MVDPFNLPSSWGPEPNTYRCAICRVSMCPGRVYRVAGRRCLHLSLGRSSTVRPNACGLTQRIRVFICVTAFHFPPLPRPA